MRRVAFAIASLVLAGPALAQYAPRPPMPIGPMAGDDVADIVEAMGLDPLGPPLRSGPFFVQRAADDFGRVLRVTVDARRSQVVAIEASTPRTSPGRYAGSYRRPHPGYAMGPDDDFDLVPPGSLLAPRVQLPHGALPPPHVAPARPPARSAAVAPQRPPVPRKRPASAPEQASAGSVEPVAPVPPPAPSAAPSENPVPARPAEPALTPVAPLE